MIKSLLRWAIPRLIAAAYDAYKYVGDLPRIIASRPPNYNQIVAALESQERDRFAIIAPHPTKTLTFSLRNLISALVENDYAVIVLTCNEGSISWLRDEYKGVYLAPRSIHGRDFGAWKYMVLAMLRSNKLRNRMQRLLLANDSVYFNKQGARSLVSFLTASKRAWACTYENYEIHYHAQSFLLGFGVEGIRNPAFGGFWEKYVPFGGRPHSINKGEVALSSAMRKAVGVPDCYVSSERLAAAIKKMTDEQTVIAISALQKCRVGPRDEFRRLLVLTGKVPGRGGGYSAMEKSDLAKEMLWDSVVSLMETKNPTHLVGLVVNQVLEVPLKRDICLRGNYHMAHVVEYCVGYDATEVEVIKEDLRDKGVPEAYRGVRRILYAHGRL